MPFGGHIMLKTVIHAVVLLLGGHPCQPKHVAVKKVAGKR